MRVVCKEMPAPPFLKGVARYIDDDDDDEKKETYYDPHMHFYKINFFFFSATCDHANECVLVIVQM